MTIIHADDPTTRFLPLLYSQREDIKAHVTEKSTNMEVIRAIRGDDTIMMLGHGCWLTIRCLDVKEAEAMVRDGLLNIVDVRQMLQIAEVV